MLIKNERTSGIIKDLGVGYIIGDEDNRKFLHEASKYTRGKC